MAAAFAGLPVQRAAAIVDLGAIKRNVERLRADLTEGAEFCAVIKADGYGHGLNEVAGAALAGGADLLAVATAIEAWEVRERHGTARILILGALGDAELDVALGAGAELAVWHPRFVEEVATRAAALGKRPRIHVKYDTGMGRLGEADPNVVRGIVAAVAESEDLALAGLWTHFATADDPDPGYLEEQLARFLTLGEELRDLYPGLVLHAANSAATIREPRSHLDMVRCGVAIYGLDPFGRDPGEQQLEPAMSLFSYLAAVKPVQAGDSAGYGRRWRAAAETVLGVIPFGYGDGYGRAFSDNAEVLIGGERFPVVGAVSMDNVAVDLGAGSGFEPGEQVVLMGAGGEQRISAEELAERIETINYEITCGVSARVPRIHLGARAPAQS